MNKYFNIAIYLYVIIHITSAYAQTETSQKSHALSFAAYSGEGHFGFELETQIAYLPVRYEFNSGNWGFQLLAPMLEVDGPGSVLVNLGGVNRIFAGNERRKASGLGDVIGTAIYRIPRSNASAPFVDLRLDVKLPTANEQKGLGSGETDYNLQVDLSHYLGNWLVFGTLGYSIRGNSALYPDLVDGVFGQVGAALPLNQSVSVGLIYDYREAVASFTSDIHEVGPYLNWQLTDNWSLTGMTMVGLTNSSVDTSVLGQLRFSW